MGLQDNLKEVPVWRQELRHPRRTRSWKRHASHDRDRLEVLGDLVMTRATARRWIAGCTVTASVFLLASCTSDAGDGKTARTSSRPSPSSARTAGESSEKRLTEQAQTALAAARSGRSVESGAERLTDGIHTEPSLHAGKTYELRLVCVGHGAAQLRFKPTGNGTPAKVPCDQSVVRQRISAGEQIHIDVDATHGSNGVVAWEIASI
ncbi:hypothetical protein ACGFT2_25415 [Streptomyces sp. NPDC048514]|uniref:hypothetical protein n=1 Tax=Streptomyces sp. NPDC048514 TaxID=3365564 RepID=UPI003716AB9F